MVPFVTVALDARVVEVVIDAEGDWETDEVDTPVVTTVV
jgi:hypothetical protein